MGGEGEEEEERGLEHILYSSLLSLKTRAQPEHLVISNLKLHSFGLMLH